MTVWHARDQSSDVTNNVINMQSWSVPTRSICGWSCVLIAFSSSAECLLALSIQSFCSREFVNCGLLVLPISSQLREVWCFQILYSRKCQRIRLRLIGSRWKLRTNTSHLYPLGQSGSSKLQQISKFLKDFTPSGNYFKDSSRFSSNVRKNKTSVNRK